MPGADNGKTSFLGAISPWGTSKSSTSQSTVIDNPDGKDALQRSQGEDHTVLRRYKISQRHYPEDCPPLKVRWFYAVDSPKRKPVPLDQKKDDQKPLPLPKKFVPFSPGDSQSIEVAFQRLPDVEDKQAPIEEPSGNNKDESVRVPVNEDYLFDVDIDRRELGPAYWVGPVYEVRRGTWFFQDGSTFKPCEENLATQLEEGYIKMRPWRSESDRKSRSRVSSTARTKEHGEPIMSDSPASGSNAPPSAHSAPTNSNPENAVSDDPSPSLASGPANYRLFGAYMNSIVTYHDSSTAWLTSDDFVSRVSTTVYQKLGGVGGTKIVRGFNEAKRPRDMTDGRNPDRKHGEAGRMHQEPYNGIRGAPTSAGRKQDTLPSRPLTPANQDPRNQNKLEDNPRITLERRVSSSLASETRNTADLEEQARIKEEQEMEDSSEFDCEDRDREIDHLVLVTHGIGQRLGLRLESINFIHDVNSLRKTLKGVYKASPGLQELNSSFADNKRNCRVQVLPV